jgi:transcriptional regulator with XRE-family HTH domain
MNAHGRVTFPPRVRVTLKAPKPKGFRGPLVTVGDHIKAHRLELGMFQKDVARELGVDQWTLLNWEKGRTTPLVMAYPAIVAWLGYDPTPTPATIADRLKARRREMGWTIKETADRLGVDPTAVGNWEHGGTILCREHRKHIAAFIGVDEKAVHEEMRRAWNAAHGKPTASDPPE